MLERETSREKNLEKIAKDARVKARREAARNAELVDTVTDEDLAEVRRVAVCAWCFVGLCVCCLEAVQDLVDCPADC
jgi:hypothetical protein